MAKGDAINAGIGLGNTLQGAAKGMPGARASGINMLNSAFGGNRNPGMMPGPVGQEGSGTNFNPGNLPMIGGNQNPGMGNIGPDKFGFGKQAGGGKLGSPLMDKNRIPSFSTGAQTPWGTQNPWMKQPQGPTNTIPNPGQTPWTPTPNQPGVDIGPSTGLPPYGTPEWWDRMSKNQPPGVINMLNPSSDMVNNGWGKMVPRAQMEDFYKRGGMT